MKNRIKFIMACLLVVFGTLPAVSRATTNTFSFFDFPGATDTRPNNINNLGKIVGDYQDYTHGFTYEAGVAAPFDYPGAPWSFAYGINNLGHISGVFRGSDGYNHSYIYINGSFNPFGVPGMNTNAGSINDYDQVVGHVNNYASGFFYDKGSFDIFVYPGDSIKQTAASGINNDGVIAGYYIDKNGITHGFTKSKDKDDFIPIDYPGALNTYLRRINNNGVMVGSYDTELNGLMHGFFYQGGVFTPFDIPDYTDINVRGISDDGRIVGRATDAEGNFHGFLATPVPVPGAVLLFGSGLLWLARSRKFKKS